MSYHTNDCARELPRGRGSVGTFASPEFSGSLVVSISFSDDKGIVSSTMVFSYEVTCQNLLSEYTFLQLGTGSLQRQQ